MQEQQQHIYTAGDIQDYHNGKLDAREMYAMEKAALDDPFLAEAMEGFNALKGQEKTLAPYLATLNKHFASAGPVRNHPGKLRSMSLMAKVAAALVIICSGVALTMLFTDSKKETPPAVLAKLDTAVQQYHSEAGSTATRDSAEIPGSPANQQPPVVKEDRKITAQVSPGEETQGLRAETSKLSPSPVAPDTISDIPITASTTQSEDLAAREQSAAIDYDNEVKKNEVARLKKASSARGYAGRNLYQFKGRVTDKNNNPVPFANISLKDNNTRSYTDVNGNFSLTAPDSLVNVAIRAVGSGIRSVTLAAKTTDNLVILDKQGQVNRQDAQLKKAAILPVTYRLHSEVESTSAKDALPLDGWDNYNRYLTNNLHLSPNIIRQHLHKKVRVSIDLDGNGGIQDVLITPSLCPECDQEIIRLIKEGPSWKILQGERAAINLQLALQPF